VPWGAVGKSGNGLVGNMGKKKRKRFGELTAAHLEVFDHEKRGGKQGGEGEDGQCEGTRTEKKKRQATRKEMVVGKKRYPRGGGKRFSQKGCSGREASSRPFAKGDP